MQVICTYLEQHELVEGLVPLHEKDTSVRGTTQVAVTIVRVPTHGTAHTAFCVWHFGCHCKLPTRHGHESVLEEALL